MATGEWVALIAVAVGGVASLTTSVIGALARQRRRWRVAMRYIASLERLVRDANGELPEYPPELDEP